MSNRYDVIVIGGGLAGLISANLLSKSGRNVLLIEKKKYPFHKVCGEYVSNEVLHFFTSLGFDPFEHGASSISKLRISTPKGKNIYVPLDLGAFGISRFVMDHALAKLAIDSGVKVITDEKVNDVLKDKDGFTVTTTSQRYFSRLAIGSYGKRDILDKKLKRSFIEERTHYLGVKYHVRIKYPVDEIGLDSFSNGYCGIVKIENDLYNLCYLYKRKDDHFTIDELQEKVLFKNPVLRDIFQCAELVFDKPIVINEISFRKKTISENSIFMCGDSAGLIAPLCGNGMSMAIQSARMLTNAITGNSQPGNVVNDVQLRHIEQEYYNEWKKQFSFRLRTGRALQSVFGNTLLTSTVLNTIHAIPALESWLISRTHGRPY